MEKLDEEVRARLILRDQSCHLRVDRLSQRLKQREITAHVYRGEYTQNKMKNEQAIY